MDKEQAEKDTRDILQPYLDLFGAADGGVGFVKLKALLEAVHQDPTPLSVEFITDLEKVGGFLRRLL